MIGKTVDFTILRPKKIAFLIRMGRFLVIWGCPAPGKRWTLAMRLGPA